MAATQTGAHAYRQGNRTAPGRAVDARLPAAATHSRPARRWRRGPAAAAARRRGDARAPLRRDVPVTVQGGHCASEVANQGTLLQGRRMGRCHAYAVLGTLPGPNAAILRLRLGRLRKPVDDPGRVA